MQLAAASLYFYAAFNRNRRSTPRVYLNIMSVFLVSGLWHGANWMFVVWAGLNGFYVVLAPLSSRGSARLSTFTMVPAVLRSFLSSLLTFHLILVTWVFFRASSLADAVTILSRIGASLSSLPALIRARLTSAELLLAVALIGLLLTVEAFDEKRPVWERLRARPLVVRWAVCYALIFGLIVLGTWNLQQFVYMQF